MAGRDAEADIGQDGAARVVGETHGLEADLACADGKGGCARRVADLGCGVEEAEQLFHVGKGVADLAINGAEEIERDEELDQEGVDQHEVAQGHAPGGDAVHGEGHHGDEAGRDDQGLTDVEPSERGLGAYGGVFGIAQGGLEAFGLKGLVAEDLDGLEVEQAIDGVGVGACIGGVHGAPVLQSPVGDEQGKADVHHEGE